MCPRHCTATPPLRGTPGHPGHPKHHLANVMNRRVLRGVPGAPGGMLLTGAATSSQTQLWRSEQTMAPRGHPRVLDPPQMPVPTPSHQEVGQHCWCLPQDDVCP